VMGGACDTPRVGVLFLCVVYMYMYVCTGKNLTKIYYYSRIEHMEPELDYYARNKQARKEYQRLYYERNKGRIQRKRKLEEIEDPKKFEYRKSYNQSYYQKNKEKILKKRAEAYATKKRIKAGQKGDNAETQS